MQRIRKIIREVLEENVFNTKKFNSFDSLSEEDLREIARWGLLNDYNSSGAWDCADWETGRIEEAIDCSLDDFKHFLNEPFPQGLKNFPKEAILYRFITLEKEEKLNKNNLGISWFADENIIKTGSVGDNEDSFFSQLLHLTKDRQQGHGLYLIKALIPQAKVNIPKTLWQRSTQYRENEVVLKDDSNLKLISLKKVS